MTNMSSNQIQNYVRRGPGRPRLDGTLPAGSRLELLDESSTGRNPHFEEKRLARERMDGLVARVQLIEAELKTIRTNGSPQKLLGEVINSLGGLMIGDQVSKRAVTNRADWGITRLSHRRG